jgi:hypothetical protein
MKYFFFVAFVSLGLAACNGINPLNHGLSKAPPYTKYIRSLEQAKLDKSAMAQQWIAAGENSLYDSVIITAPFSESGYFIASEPTARSYRFDGRKGQVLTVTGDLMTKNSATFFLDLLVWDEDQWTAEAHADSTMTLTYEFEEDEKCIVRLQPELLVTAYYTISISITPVLINPVAGATNKSIGSFYGDSRDGGKRSHEGIDIFAKKGTPVIAPTDGIVTRVTTGKLGGKVVWMQDRKRGHSYYFAHLDEQLVMPSTVVKKGDTLGTVGNTGNARNTPSHLHFGIYQNKSLDPVDFVKTLEEGGATQPWDTTWQQYDYKVVEKKAALHSGPGSKMPARVVLAKDTYMQIIGQSNDWFRVRLPDQRQGFVPKKNIAPIQKGKKLKISDSTVVLSEIHPGSIPLVHLNANSSVELLATFNEFKFVKTRDGIFGWLKI